MSLVAVQRAAVRRFAERGYAAVGIRELGRELGLSSAALYHYASGKQDLLLGVMTCCLEEMLAAARREVAAEDDPVAQLVALVGVHVAMSAVNPDTSRVTDQEVRALDAANRAAVVALRDRYERIWQHTLAAGVRRGAFDVPDLRLTRLALLDMCTGIANWYDATGRTTVAAMQRHYAVLACRSVGARVPRRVRAVTMRRLDCEPVDDGKDATA